ncbi:hypothetical protein K432DRAFT_312020, partial [Lepidopterella palustris CBS 459.81]
TKLKEDKAYLLLGIFGVHILLIHGEVGDSAFKRLKEKIDMPIQMEKEEQECT